MNVMVALSSRCNDNAQLFHNVERVPFDVARSVEPDGDERLGRGVHVLHLRLPAGVRVRELRGQEASVAQRRLSSRRESRHPGRYAPSIYRSEPFLFLSNCCCYFFLWITTVHRLRSNQLFVFYVS